MKEIVMVVLCSVLIFTTSCMTKEDYEAAIRVEPIITNWLPNETFVVVDAVKKVDGFEMGRVIVRRNKDGVPFSAMVIPIKEIPVGSEVKIARVDYMHHHSMQKDFLLVR